MCTLLSNHRNILARPRELRQRKLKGKRDWNSNIVYIKNVLTRQTIKHFFVTKHLKFSNKQVPNELKKWYLQYS